MRAGGGAYLADALRLGIFGYSMVVELLGLAAELGDLAANEPEQALVHSLNVALVGEILGGALTRLEMRRVELGIELMEYMSEDDATAELVERVGLLV